MCIEKKIKCQNFDASIVDVYAYSFFRISDKLTEENQIAGQSSTSSVCQIWNNFVSGSLSIARSLVI